MPLIPVSDSQTIEDFYRVPYLVYENDPNWIPPLRKDLAFIFDPNSNPAFKENALQRWVLKDEKNRNIGRIAAFTKSQQIENEDCEVGGMGFFECIEDQEAAFTLFNQAREWLETKGAQAMDGPINFGERDRFWGLLVEGFKPPSYQENYNPPYYQTFFEEYGFQQYFLQKTFELSRDTVKVDRLNSIVERVIHSNNIKVKTLELDKVDQYAEDFITIYNRAWENFQDFKPLNKQEVKELLTQVKPILEKDFMLFAYSEGKPAGLLFMLPDVNQIFKHFDGKMGWWEKLKFLWHRKKGTMDKLKGVVMGIHPDYQGKGIDAMLVHNLIKNVESNKQYQHAELSWIGGFNPKMQAMMKKLNAQVSKVHITYRKIFDPNITFEPYKIEE